MLLRCLRYKINCSLEMETGKKKKKQQQRSSHGGVAVESSCWEEMSRELLSLVFVRIPTDELARAVPFVCRSWCQAVAEPYCWSHIEVEQWCRRCNESDVIDAAVRKLVRRSAGTLRSLCAYKLSDASFSSVADSGQYLKVLKIPVSYVTDKMVVKHAVSFSNLTVLDISYCLMITGEGIEAFGKNCKSLIELRRNMPPPDFNSHQSSQSQEAEEYEAAAVADTMSGLIHLELGYGRFSDDGLDAILCKCNALRHLDIRGCWNVKMEGDLDDRCDRIEEFMSPWDDELEDTTSSDGDSNVSNED